MNFDYRLTRLEKTMSVCPACLGKPRIVIIDETEHGKDVSSAEPENCAVCGNPRDTTTIVIRNQETPLPDDRVLL